MAVAKPAIPTLNFLQQRRTRLAVLNKQDRYLLWGSLGFFTVVVAITLGLVIWSIILKQKAESLTETQAQNNRTLSSLADTEAQYLVFTQRLKIISELWPARGSQQQTLQFLTDISDPMVKFQNVQYEQESKQLSFSVFADDFFGVEKFLEQVRASGNQERIGNLEVTPPNRNDQGSYSFEATIVLQEGQ
jgi:Tfp pilus assembly protein PilN